MTNMMAMMKKAQEMQKNLQIAQTEMAKATFSATAGNTVTITLTGEHALQSIEIKPENVDLTDISLLEDLIKIAHNEALNKAQETAKSKMQAITGGLNIPGF